ncbi:MAG: AI-2E family transporter YdiK [Myxococcota bacterium]
MSRELEFDLPRTLLQVLAIGGLIAGAFWVMSPFLGALTWATMMVVATWPVLLRVQALLWGRRVLAVAVMTIALLLVLILPLYAGTVTIVENSDKIAVLTDWVVALASSPAPDWVGAIPLAGPRIAAGWSELAARGPDAISDQLAPHVRDISGWLLGEAGSLGSMLIQFLLTVGIAAILYSQGEAAAALLRRFAQRVGGEQGDHSVRLAGQAIQAVALGVVVTAMVQSALAGLGLAITGVPFAGVLTAVIFVLCVAQLGPGLVFIPAIAWMYWQGNTVWATALVVWALPVTALDGVLRPYLIRMGADLPLLLILPGVIGGLIAFGVLGLFIGPVLLAVGYTLLVAWLDDGATRAAPPE